MKITNLQFRTLTPPACPPVSWLINEYIYRQKKRRMYKKKKNKQDEEQEEGYLNLSRRGNSHGYEV